MNAETELNGKSRNWRTGMVIFGLFIFVLGLLSLAIGVLLLVVLSFASVVEGMGGTVQLRNMIPGIALYMGIGGVFVWLGIGSVMARRWARALILILSALWSTVGMLTMLLMSRWLPAIMNSMVASGEISVSMVRIVMFCAVIGIAIVYVVVPGVLFLFYRSRHVKYTVEKYDLKTRWTDACPLPVLALAMIFFSGGFFFLFSFAYNCLVPFFGIMLHGFTGAAMVCGLIALHVYLGIGVFHRKIQAWWAAVAYVLLMGISSIITFSRVDILMIYQELRLIDQSQLKMMEDFFSSRMMLEMTIPWIVLMVLYLLAIKRYFQEEPVQPGTVNPPPAVVE